MSLSHADTRRRLGGHFRLALAALGLAGLIGASAPAHSSAARFLSAAPPPSIAERVASPAVSAPAAQAGAPCAVYPIVFDEQRLMNSPTGPGPRPMPNPWADVGAIPQYSRFRVTVSSTQRQWDFLTWDGDQSSMKLAAALVGGGTLGAGFIEGKPPADDPSAGRQVNGIAEAGDWLTVFTNQRVGINDVLYQHIDRRTLMVVPVSNAVAASGGRITRISQFVRVRLLGYSLNGGSNYLDLGLVAHLSPYACFQYQTPLLVGQTAIITPSMPLSATLERRWDFGDGSPVSTALTPTHVYAQPGTYTVTLTLPRLVPFQAVGRIEVTRPLLPPQVFLPATLGDSAP